ncbi:MAG: mechanosensitive ion channel, partial [Methanosarcinaceae archaeon]|nr:mechanosensitive ion channel [Methanosarcinaceae archaeon]
MLLFFIALSEGQLSSEISLNRFLDWLSGDVSIILSIILISLATVFFARLADHLMRSYFKKIADRLHVDLTAFRMLRHITIGIIYFLGLVAIISQIPNLEKLSVALFTGAGVAGIVIGFAAQSTLSNVIAGLSLAIFQPFRVGDRVTLRSEYGKITDLNLRHTVITTWDNRRLIIPNAVVSQEAVINWTIEDPAVIWPINIGISYDSDIDLARKIMLEEAKK